MRKPKNFGDKNSQYGTIWITDGIENAKIYKEEKFRMGGIEEE